MVRGATTNTATSGNAFYMNVYGRNANKTSGHWLYPGGVKTASTIYNDVWTKISGYVTVPANMFFCRVSVIVEPNAGTYYFDEAKMYRVTAANAINKALYNANDPAASILTGAVPALDGSKITGGTVAEARIAPLSQSKITNLTTDLSSITTGSSNTINYLYDAFDGTEGNTNKTISDMRNRGATVRASAVAGESKSTALNTALYNSQTPAATILTGAVPSLDGSKITGGTVAEARIAQLSQAKVTNLTTDLTTIDDKAVAAQTHSNIVNDLLAGALASGANLIPDGGFEAPSGTFVIRNSALSTEQKRSGTQSLKFTRTLDTTEWYSGAGFATKTGGFRVPCKQGDVFRVEGWVYGHASNSGTYQPRFYFNVWNVAQTGGVQWPTVYMTANVGQWTKFEADLSITHPDAGFFDVSLAFNAYPGSYGVPANQIFYFDDFAVYRVTETAATNTALYNSTVPASTVLAAVVPTLDASKVTTGNFDQNRVTNLTSDLSSITTGSSNTINYLYDAFDGTTGNTNKTISDMRNRGATVRASAVAGESKSTALNTALYNSQTPAATILTGAVPAIDGSKINTGTLAEDRIASLSATKISSGTFADARIPNLATSKITSGTFGNTRIADLAINNAKISADVDASKITSGNIAEARIADLSAGKITSGSFADARIPNLATSKITFGTFGTGFIADAAITGAKTASLDASKVTTGTLGAAIIGAGTIDNTKIASGVDAAKLTTGTLPIERIAAGAVDNTKIATGVDAAKLTTGTLPIARIGTGAVDNTKIASGVDAAKLTTGTLPIDRIGTGAITTVKIGDSQVTGAKTAGLDGSKITGGTIGEGVIPTLPQSKVTGLPTDVTVDSTLLEHNQKIQALESTLLANENQGKSMSINFANYADGALPATFTVEYLSGTGTSTIQVVGGIARWVYGTTADRTARIVYTGDGTENGKTLTNYRQFAER